MNFVIIFEQVLILLSNGIRFYAVKRYIDFFVSRDKSRWKYNWLLYIFACIGTYFVSAVFSSLILNVLINILAIFMLTIPYQIKKSEKVLMTFVIYGLFENYFFKTQFNFTLLFIASSTFSPYLAPQSNNVNDPIEKRRFLQKRYNS